MVGKIGSASPKHPVKQWNRANPLETLKDLATDLRQEFADDFLKGTANDILSESAELLGLRPRKKISGTLSPEETLDVRALEIRQQEEIVTPKDRRPTSETKVFRPLPENFLFRQNERAIEQEIEVLLSEIKKEIKRFDEATKMLEKEAAKVAIEEIPPNPGIYHINFFEWLLGILKNLRQKVEDANAWITLLQSKKAKKGYWARFKKHGTSFGLSSERVVATQTG